MPIAWEADPGDGQREFELAAVEAARGWIAALSALNDALQREEKLKRQVAVLIGLEDPRK